MRHGSAVCRGRLVKNVFGGFPYARKRLISKRKHGINISVLSNDFHPFFRSPFQKRSVSEYMRKFKGITIGGIQQKIFNLVLITIILMVAAYSAVILYQSGELTNLVRETNETQKRSISDISEETMAAVLDANLTQSTQMEAFIAEDVFDDTLRVVNVVADYTDVTTDLFSGVRRLTEATPHDRISVTLF